MGLTKLKALSMLLGKYQSQRRFADQYQGNEELANLLIVCFVGWNISYYLYDIVQ